MLMLPSSFNLTPSRSNVSLAERSPSRAMTVAQSMAWPSLSVSRICSPANAAAVTSVEVWTTPPASRMRASVSGLPIGTASRATSPAGPAPTITTSQ